ncbi:PrgI family protein, partial [Dysosmobacter welbionis]
GQAPGNGPEIGCSLRPGSVRSAEEPGNLGGEAPADDGRTETAGGNQGGGVTDGVIRLLLLAAAEAQADVGGAAVSQQQGHGIHQNDHRERHVDGRHGGDPHALAHKDLVHDVVEAVDHQRQGRGDGVAD